MVDWEKAEKLPPDQRYFNISVLWIFYYRYVLRLCYYLRIPHEAVTILSIACGVISAALFYEHKYVLGAIALHFKDIFDACDGALARLTGRGHLIGRYLDSVGDFLSLTLVVIAIALSAESANVNMTLLVIIAAALSLFLQCSFFNYYQLAYLKIHSIERLLSETDELNRADLDDTAGSAVGRMLLGFLRYIYLIVYGWQDRLVAAIDRSLLRSSGASEQAWYDDKSMMVPQSALCFGTHIFIVIVFAIVGRPELSLWFIIAPMNIFLVSLLLIRRYRLRLRHPKPQN